MSDPVVTRAVERRVIQLLRTYTEALEDADGKSGSSDPLGLKLMSSMWNEGSYAELERALRRMRDGGPKDRQQWWHVSARYFWTDQKTVVVPVRRSRLGPLAVAPRHAEIELVIEMSYASARVRVTTWSSEVSMDLVKLGVARLADLMYDGDVGRVVVPRSMVAA